MRLPKQTQKNYEKTSLRNTSLGLAE